MDRAWKSGASATPPVAPSSPSIGYPTSGDAGGGVPKTVPGPHWHHMITEELRNIIVAAGLTPSHLAVNQVLSALQALFVGGASFTGANQSLGGNGYQKLPGGFILQWATGVTDSSGNITLTNPVAFSVGPIGGIANEAVPSGWGVSNTTVWSFDLAASTATTSIARERSVSGGSVAPAAGISGRILVWGK